MSRCGVYLRLFTGKQQKAEQKRGNCSFHGAESLDNRDRFLAAYFRLSLVTNILPNGLFGFVGQKQCFV